MFIGHYAVGLAGKKYAENLSLGTLFLAVQLVDHLWPFFLLAGIEIVQIEFQGRCPGFYRSRIPVYPERLFPQSRNGG